MAAVFACAWAAVCVLVVAGLVERYVARPAAAAAVVLGGIALLALAVLAARELVDAERAVAAGAVVDASFALRLVRRV